MKLLILNDGTIPVVVSRVIETDGDDLPDRTQSDAGWDVRLVDIPDGSRYLGIYWSPDLGFDWFGFETYPSASRWLRTCPAGSHKGPVTTLTPRHDVVVYDEGEDLESYAHLFTLTP